MILRFALFLVYLLSSVQVWAIGIGEVELRSALGEPLDMRVSLTLSDSEKSSDARVSLASLKEYQLFKQDIPASYAFIKVKMSGSHDNIMKVVSKQPIIEPYLTLIIKLEQGKASAFKKIVLFDDVNLYSPYAMMTKIKKVSERHPTLQIEPVDSQAQAMMQGNAMQENSVKLKLTERLDVVTADDIIILDASILNRVDALQPLFVSALGSSLRFDSSLPIYSMDNEVRLLEQELNALLQGQLLTQERDPIHWGYWLLLSLVIEIMIVSFLLLRLWKRNRQPQRPLRKAKRMRAIQVEPDIDDQVEMAKPKPPELKVRQTVKLVNAVKASQKKEDAFLVTETKALSLSDTKQQKSKSHAQDMKSAACFEIAVNKGIWQAANTYYHLLTPHMKMQPRIQALYVHILHLQGQTLDRNRALLDIHEHNDITEWNQFVGLIDSHTWKQLQDEHVINLSSDLDLKALRQSNQQAKNTQILLGEIPTIN